MTHRSQPRAVNQPLVGGDGEEPSFNPMNIRSDALLLAPDAPPMLDRLRTEFNQTIARRQNGYRIAAVQPTNECIEPRGRG
jgi:hypothetical protein